VLAEQEDGGGGGGGSPHGSQRSDGSRSRSGSVGRSGSQQSPSQASESASYHTPPPMTPDNRGPNSSLDELALADRLETLLYTTESQAGALLREMDAIRMERELDRERMRDKTSRLNTMVEKFNAMTKKNKKLVRTLHNRRAPLPSMLQILTSQNLLQYERLFAKKKINSAMLLSMDDSDLWSTVSMKRGHRRKLLNAMKKFLIGPRMPTLPTPIPTPLPSAPSTVRLDDEDGGVGGGGGEGGVDGDGESKNSDDSSIGATSEDSEGESDLDDMGSESEEEHIVDMDGA